MPSAQMLSWGSLALAGLALAAEVALALLHRARRRRAWLTDPRALLAPPETHSLIHVAAGVAAIVASFVANTSAAGLTTFLACALATFAALAAFHQSRNAWLGAVGLLLAGTTAVALFLAVGFPWWPALVVGAAWAGAWLLWLAQFWRQQLGPDGPWTSTGRLILPARVLGILAAPGILAAILALVLVPGAAANLSATWFVLVALGTAAFAVVLTRDARYRAPVDSA